MCGICGVIDFRCVLDLKPSVQKMAVRLAHRGPDDCDVQIYLPPPGGRPRAALGHRRLAIIDLSEAGRQPMQGRTADVAVILNGEIYNFQEKRRECSDYPYRSRTDTEVILALYEKYGENFVEHLDGMFAIALWDNREQKLILARDRAGKKPLYYFQSSEFFAFASEIKSLLALPEVPHVLNDAALPLYLTFGYVPTPETFYASVKKVEPATLMVVERTGKSRTRMYWKYPLHGVSSTSEAAGSADHEETLRRLMRDAVSCRMIADVPLGAFLSGGIDSSIVVGVMSQLTKEPVKSFSIGFEGDSTYDETSYARLVSKAFDTRHTEFHVRPNAIELLEKLVWHYDEPFGDSSAIPTFIVSQLTREHVTVALSGDGGDELFAGYERFAAMLLAERLPKGAFAAGHLLSRALPAPAHAKSTRRRIKRFLEKAALPLLDRYLEWNSFFTRDELNSLMLHPASTNIARSFEECFADAHAGTLLQRILFLNYRTYLLDDLLVKTDRMSMANGLEVRCPFLDTRLVEWAAQLPDHLKICRGQLKYILKRAYRDLLPKEILSRGKMGFGVPLGHWMRKDLKEFSHDMLLGSSAKIRDLLDFASVQRLLLEHQGSLEDHGQKIWALLCLEVWLRNSRHWESPALPVAEIRSA